MSLYSFYLTDEKAIVTADSRMSVTIDDEVVVLNDTTDKIFHVDNDIITISGYADIGTYLAKWYKNQTAQERTMGNLHQKILDTVNNLQSLVEQNVISEVQKQKMEMDKEHLLEINIVHWDEQKGRHIFYNIASYNQYNLFDFDMEGTSKIYSGNMNVELQEYMKGREYSVDCIKEGYNAIAYEGVGGQLTIMTSQKGNITIEKDAIKDNRKVKTIQDMIIEKQNLIGNCIAGNKVVIENESPEGKNIQFRVDATGVYLNNARFLTSCDNNQVAIDPAFGLAIGNNPLYSVSSSTGELILNKANANLYTDINGDLVTKGKVYAKDGVFNGTVNANDGIFKGTIQANKYLDFNNNDMFINGKFKSDYLDLRGLNIVNPSGATTLSIDDNGLNINSGSINWNNVNSDPKATDALDDIDALARGEYTKAGKTFINGNYIYSPNIQAGKFFGAEYLDTNGIAKLTLSEDNHYSDLLYRNIRDNYDLFKIRDSADGTITLLLGDVPVLRANLNTGKAYLDDGIKVPFVFA